MSKRRDRVERTATIEDDAPEPSLALSPAIKAAGRWWSHEDLFRLRQDWENPALLIKEILNMYNVRGTSSLTRPTIMAKLGLPKRGFRHGGPAAPFFGNPTLGRLTLPKDAHPTVMEFYRIVNQRLKTMKWVGARAGMPPGTLFQWRTKDPQVKNLDRALRALGMTLAVVPISSAPAQRQLTGGSHDRAPKPPLPRSAATARSGPAKDNI